ncbi:MAG: Mrp/NBP35 family ATP-binding protein [Alphaproteobacteria bacterium]|nr:Mrp/NBP35 family ATP-binding protein [Alphaproteobacteria bacterium]
MITKEKIEKILSNFEFRGKSVDLLGLNYVQDIIVNGDIVKAILNVNEENAEFINDLDKEFKRKLYELEGIASVKTVLSGAIPPKESMKKSKIRISGVRNVILVSSGKGGVGKSTISFLLSKSLAEHKYKVGVLDADVYGPSFPTLTNKSEKPNIVDGKMIPHIFGENIKVNSIGYLMPPEKALIWRGPMITKALHQLVSSTVWGELDYLIIDMPPGTGDIHLTLCEKYHIDGAIIVSTPQSLAIADVSRAIDMYKKMSVRIIGMVQNMSYFIGKDGSKEYIFGDGEELRRYSASLSIPIIAEVPIDPNIENNQESLDSLSSSMISSTCS